MFVKGRNQNSMPALNVVTLCLSEFAEQYGQFSGGYNKENCIPDE